MTVDDEIPDNAVEGGEDDGNTLYVAKANYGKDEMPARVTKSDAIYAVISYAGKEIPVKKFKVK